MNSEGNNVEVKIENWCSMGQLNVRLKRLKVMRLYDESVVDENEIKLDGLSIIDYGKNDEGLKLIDGYFGYICKTQRGVDLDTLMMIVREEGWDFDGVDMVEYNRYMEREKRLSRDRSKIPKNIF